MGMLLGGRSTLPAGKNSTFFSALFHKLAKNQDFSLKNYPVIAAFMLAATLIILCPAQVDAKSLEETGLKISFGYRVDELVWNTAGNINGTNPNILSELTWEDIESYTQRLSGNAHLKAKKMIPGDIAFRGYFEYGDITEGKNQDSDYLGDNRTQEFSRSNNRSDSGSVLDSQFGAGIRISKYKKITFTPLLGWSYHGQNLNITDGYQTLSMFGQTGPITGLDSSYDTQWFGPWTGFDLTWIPLKKLSFQSTFQLHSILEYTAEANWNLRTDYQHPVSFKHHAENGYGLLLAFDGAFHLTSKIAFNLNMNYNIFKIDDGTHTVFLSNGSSLKTKLNEVEWRSSSVMIGINFLIF